jgi:inorganic pyrophosphatase
MIRLSVCSLLLAAQSLTTPPPLLPAAAVSALRTHLRASAPHVTHVWRDTPPVNADGSINAYVEIPRGERRKFEFDPAANQRRVDRVMPQSLGGYPINYGFVPQTVSYDGDPFDALVLGPPLPGGTVLRGVIVGIMHMEDEKGLDSKVLLSRVDSAGKATHRLGEAERQEITDFFNRYKRHEPGKFSRVPGWGDAEVGRRFVGQTHAFYLHCRSRDQADCSLP